MTTHNDTRNKSKTTHNDTRNKMTQSCFLSSSCAVMSHYVSSCLCRVQLCVMYTYMTLCVILLVLTSSCWLSREKEQSRCGVAETPHLNKRFLGGWTPSCHITTNPLPLNPHLIKRFFAGWTPQQTFPWWLDTVKVERDRCNTERG
jgi:hypothetical protein